MPFWHVKNKVLTRLNLQKSGGRLSAPTNSKLLDAGEQFLVAIGVLFEQVRRRKGQENQGLFRAQDVHAPNNRGSVDLARARLAVVRHAIQNVLAGFALVLHVLDSLRQFL